METQNAIPILSYPLVNENVALTKKATELNGIINALYSGFSPAVGDYFMGLGKVGANTASPAALVANTLYANPIFVPQKMTFDYIAVQVTTTHNGQHIRLGIYNFVAGLPTTLLADLGVITLGAAASFSTLAITLTLAAGIYFTAYISDSSTVQLGKVVNNWFCARGWTADTNGYAQHGQLSKAAVGYAALPNPFPATPTVIASGNFTWTGLRIASIP